MKHYYVYGMKVETGLEFPQLVAASKDGREDRRAIDLFIVELKPQDDVIEMCHSGNFKYSRRLAYISNSTCILVAREGRYIEYFLKPGGNIEHLKSYILGFGMAMIGLQRDCLSVHCSALSNEDGAILIAGESGAGKSTVADMLLEKGYRLMADDMAYVELDEDENGNLIPVALPGFPYRKICRDVAERKGYSLDELIYIDEDKDKYLAPYNGEFNNRGVKISGFIYLVKTGEKEVLRKSVTGMECFYLWANNLFLRKLLKDEKYAPELGSKYLKLASLVPMTVIGRPDGANTVDRVVENVLEAISDWCS